MGHMGQKYTVILTHFKSNYVNEKLNSPNDN